MNRCKRHRNISRNYSVLIVCFEKNMNLWKIQFIGIMRIDTNYFKHISKYVLCLLYLLREDLSGSPMWNINDSIISRMLFQHSRIFLENMFFLVKQLRYMDSCLCFFFIYSYVSNLILVSKIIHELITKAYLVLIYIFFIYKIR